MDLTAIQAAISSLKAAINITRSILEMKNMADVQSKVIELQSALLEAQNCALSAITAQFELQEKIRALEAQLKEKEDWEAQKVRYQLVNPWRGPAQIYVLKRAASNGEGPHFICANCFHNGKRVILNPIKNREGFVQIVCPSCKAVMDTGYRGISEPKYAEEYDIKD